MNCESGPRAAFQVPVAQREREECTAELRASWRLHSIRPRWRLVESRPHRRCSMLWPSSVRPWCAYWTPGAGVVSATTTYRTSPTRRSGAQIDDIKAALYAVTLEIKPASVRQIYYQMVSRGFIDKTEAEYKGTVCRLLALMRRANEMPYGWITDNTRYMRKPRTYSNLAEMLDEQVKFTGGRSGAISPSTSRYGWRRTHSAECSNP